MITVARIELPFPWANAPWKRLATASCLAWLGLAHLSPDNALAVNYFVDPASTGTGNGTTTAVTGPDAAWKELSEIGGLAPGDNVFLKRGGVWREAATGNNIFRIPASGAPGARIVFASYGVGEKPIVSGARNSALDGATWTLSGGGNNEYYLSLGGGDPGYIEPVRLFLAADRSEFPRGTVGNLGPGEWDWGDNDLLGYDTVYLRSDAGVPGAVEIPQCTSPSAVIWAVQKDHITIRDIVVEMSNDTATHGIYAWACTDFRVERVETRYLRGNGIVCNGGSPFTIDDCDSHHNWNNGIGISGVGGPALENVVVTNSRVHDNAEYNSYGGGGIWVFAVDGALFHNNVIYNNTEGGMRLDGSCEGEGFGCDNSVISSNLIYDNGGGEGVPGWGGGGGGINIECGQGNVVYGNVVTGNRLAQIIATNSRALNNTVAYNIARNCTADFDSGIRASWGAHNSRILNNVVDGCWYGITLVSTDSLEVKNNIVIHAFRDMLLDQQAEASVDSDFNLLRGDGPPYFPGVDGSNVVVTGGPNQGNFTLAQWQALGHGANSLDDDPLFADETGGDFHLLVGSPCIDAGTDVGLTEDHDGSAVSSPPEIGAFEFIDPATGVGEWLAAVAPELTNMPAPFRSSTTIRFRIPAPGAVRLTVHDVAGREVAVIAEGHHDAGWFETTWAGRDDQGRKVASGVYFARLEAGERTLTRKMVVVK